MKQPIRHHVSAEVVQVIRTVHLRGEGTTDNILRNVTSYFDLDGTLIVEQDPTDG